MSEGNNSSGAKPDPSKATPEPEYKVGPGRPPREYRYKPGQSGNPKGAKRKPPSMAPDLKAALERALSKRVQVKQGDREKTLTMAAAGVEQLVAQFAKGDRYARRDLMAYAERLGIDLMAGRQQAALQEALAANHEAILSLPQIRSGRTDGATHQA
jgi:hypothetical protein